MKNKGNQLKLNIKNTQIAKALNLDSVKDKLAKKKVDSSKEKKTTAKKPTKKPVKKSVKDPPLEPVEEVLQEVPVEDAPKIKARKKSVFSGAPEEATAPTKEIEEPAVEAPIPEPPPEPSKDEEPIQEIIEEAPPQPEVVEPAPAPSPPKREKLGPTGRHVKDLLPKKKEPPPEKPSSSRPQEKKEKGAATTASTDSYSDKKGAPKRGGKGARFKEFRDLKPSRKQETRAFDARDRHGLRTGEDDHRKWRKKRARHIQQEEDTTIRPSSLTIRTPIGIKELAQEMKLKASQLIQKLFLQGLAVTINDVLDDETTIQLLGHEFECEITIDTSEEERIRITDKTIKEEVAEADPEDHKARPPVVAFMGHVDHGKTSLIDTIRKSNVASGEAGKITQHIGAFRCHTAIGDIAILDTPGHEAFSAMRARGADATDIVVLVVAGDEGIRQQTTEAIDHAKAAGVSIVVALNKCDKPGFDPENVYRQLSELELLPEAWGGQTITVNCSAVTGEGIKELLEMLALQTEILELKANPKARARGTVLESQLHKGLGAVTTLLIQNGTLHKGDAVVFEQEWGQVKTMSDEHGEQLMKAGPSTPVQITGLSGVPEAGQEFIIVPNAGEAKAISEARKEEVREKALHQARPTSMENLFEQAQESEKKVLTLIIRADVKGSAEALKTALQKITSDKIILEIISTGVGEISESDINLAAASNALIIGFHAQIESHADSLIKQFDVKVKLFDVIYHAIDEVKNAMLGRLDKLAEETDTGKAEILQIFKSSQLGIIAGCQVNEGTIHRNHHMRVIRDGEMIWSGKISSLRRVKDDVREVQKGFECGIVLSDFKDVQVGDILEAFEITYKSQEL